MSQTRPRQGGMDDRAALARPLPDEVDRQRLIDWFAQRWVTTLLTVEAPGGFGKTRALSQAVRDNDTDPSGLDVVFRAQPRHRAADVLAADLVALFRSTAAPGAEAAASVAADQICAEIAALAPTRVALLIDDAHHVAASASASALVAELLGGLPTNGRLVLVGRHLPDVPRARLVAADQVLAIGSDDLAFTADEQARLARHHGVDPAELEHLDGWPAAVRLALVAGPEGPEDFLNEEVVDQLEPAVRAALGVAVLAGQVDADLLARCGLEVSVDALCGSIPLVDRLEGPDGPAARPHDLWQTMVGRLVDGDHRSDRLEAIVGWHAAAGRHDQAISAAASAGAWDLARASVMDALGATDVGLSGDLLARWEALFPPEQRDEAELAFLRGMRERLTTGPVAAAPLIAAAMHAFEERGDTTNEALALEAHVFCCFLTNDTDQIAEALSRLPRLLEAGATSLAPLVMTLQVIGADLSGDFAGALEIASAAVEPGPPNEVTELRLRYLATLCFLVGDGDRGVAFTEQLVGIAPSARNRFVRAMARFANGQPDDILEGWAGYRYLHLDNARDDFLHGVFSCMTGAALGEPPEVERIRDIAWGRSREQTLIALCELVAAVVAGEAEAEQRFCQRVGELGLDDPLVAGELRRFLAVSYVASPAVRAVVDADESALGPHQARQLAMARILLAARRGEPVDWSGYQTPHRTLTVFPLPWSIEFACYLAEVDGDAAIELTELLQRAGGSEARALLRAGAASSGPAAAGAERLLGSLPSPPAQPTRIRTEGELAITQGSSTWVPSRMRVRQILSLLILRGSIDRDELAQLLWPERDPETARRNLSTNLTYLRRELESGRRRGEPSFHVRQRGIRVELHRSDHLQVDVWDMLDEADPGRPVVAGLVLPDLRDVPELVPDLAALDVHLRDLAASRAEALIATGDHRAAVAIAEKLVVLDRYDERAHRALIGARLGAEQADLARHDARQAGLALEELGVEPGAPLRMLLRQVAEL